MSPLPAVPSQRICLLSFNILVTLQSDKAGFLLKDNLENFWVLVFSISTPWMVPTQIVSSPASLNRVVTESVRILKGSAGSCLNLRFSKRFRSYCNNPRPIVATHDCPPSEIILYTGL